MGIWVSTATTSCWLRPIRPRAATQVRGRRFSCGAAPAPASPRAIKAVGLASHGTLSGVLPAGDRFMSTQMHAERANEPAPRDLTVYQNVVSPGFSKRPASRSCAAGISATSIAQRVSRSPSSMRPPPGCCSATTTPSASGSARAPGSHQHRSRRRGGGRKYLSVRKLRSDRVLAVPGRQPDDVAHQGAWGRSFGVGCGRAGTADTGPHVAAFYVQTIDARVAMRFIRNGWWQHWRPP